MKKQINYFLIPLISGAIALSLFGYFVMKIEFTQKVVLIEVIGSILFSILTGLLLLINSKYVRPKFYNYFLFHKNLKDLEKIDLKFIEEMNGYFGNYRNYDLQILIYHGEFDLLKTELVLNIFFNKKSIKEIKNFKINHEIVDTRLMEFAAQRIYRFVLKPPDYKQIKYGIDKIIDYFIENNFEPIKLVDLEKEFK